MAKHHSENQHKGEGVKLIGSPEELINLLIKDEKANKWVTNEIENEGPKHKQVLNALLLKRLYKLVITIETESNTKFILQKGYELLKEKEDEKIIPILLPINLGASADTEKITGAISHAPNHETLAFAMFLQIIEWAIKVKSKK